MVGVCVGGMEVNDAFCFHASITKNLKSITNNQSQIHSTPMDDAPFSSVSISTQSCRGTAPSRAAESDAGYHVLLRHGVACSRCWMKG